MIQEYSKMRLPLSIRFSRSIGTMCNSLVSLHQVTVTLAKRRLPI